LRLHYTTLGSPHRNAKGEVDNAVLIMHGTGGDGNSFFRSQFADVLFRSPALLDPAKYYIILRPASARKIVQALGRPACEIPAL